MSYTAEHVFKLMDEESKARIKAEKLADEAKQARDEAEKVAKEKRKPFIKAIKDGSTIMIKHGPFVMGQLLDPTSLMAFRSYVVSTLDYCLEHRDLETVSKAFRVCFSLPIKCRMPTPEELKKEAKISSQKAPTSTPKGPLSSETDAMFDIEPKFKRITNIEINDWLKDLYTALLAGSLNAIRNIGAKDLFLDLVPKIIRPEPNFVHSQSSAFSTSTELWFHVLCPIEGIFKTTGIDVEVCVDSGNRAIVSSRNETENFDDQDYESTQNKVPENHSEISVSRRRVYLAVESKQVGLSTFVDGNKLIARSELKSLLKRSFVYMIDHHTDMLLLSDFKTSILLKLNFEMDESSVAEPSNKSDFEEGSEPRATHNLRAEETPALQNDDSDAVKVEGTSWAQMGEEKGTNTVCVPLQYRIMSMNDTKYTHQAIIASAIYSQIKAVDSDRLRVKKQLTKLRHLVMRTEKECAELSERIEEQNEKAEDLRGASRFVELESEELSVLQHGTDYWTQVYRINRDAIGSYFHWVDTKDCKHDAVLKSYDFQSLDWHYYVDPIESYFFDDFHKYVVTMATKEIECYQRIKAFNAGADGDDRIRSPCLYDSGWGYIQRPRVDALQLSSEFHIGPYLLMSSIENTECQMTDREIVKDGLRQLELLHSIGIEHGDVKPSNYFTTREGVQFFDFSHSRLYDGAVPELRAKKECENFRRLSRKRSNGQTAGVF